MLSTGDVVAFLYRGTMALGEATFIGNRADHGERRVRVKVVKLKGTRRREEFLWMAEKLLQKMPELNLSDVELHPISNGWAVGELKSSPLPPESQPQECPRSGPV